MEKTNHSRQARARLLIDERDSLRARRLKVSIDAVALEAHVMQSTAAAREKFPDAAIGVDRFQQLDFASAGVQQRRLNALVLDRGALDELEPQRIAPELESCFEIRHHDSDVMNPLQHRRPPNSCD